MKSKASFAGILLFTVFVFSSCAQQDDIPVLKGPYLGQKPPDIIPEVLASGIVSTNDFELCSGFLNSGRLFVFNRQPRNETNFDIMPTFITELKDSRWTKPYLAPFNEYYPYNFTTAPDNKTLWFTSKHAPEGRGTPGDPNIWKTQITAEGWSEPEMLGPPVNTEFSDNYPSVTKKGTIYFMSNRDEGFGSLDIYCSELDNGKYVTAENLGDIINTEHPEQDPVIAPDESYLIYCSETLGGYGGYDLFITFRQRDGTWTKPVNMGKEVNSFDEENRANITPGGRFILFMKGTAEYANIYWVSAKIIEELKPASLK